MFPIYRDVPSYTVLFLGLSSSLFWELNIEEHDKKKLKLIK